jgi:hypothetical protein
VLVVKVLLRLDVLCQVVQAFPVLVLVVELAEAADETGVYLLFLIVIS